MSKELELVRGTLDVLILKTVAWGPRHGYDIARWIQDTSGAELRIDDGALYAGLHRLEERGWLASAWGVTDANRRAKYYKLTAAGRVQLNRQTATWLRYAAAVGRILHASA